MFQEPRTFRPGLVLAALALTAGLAAGGGAEAAEQTISGFSAWEGEGMVYEAGPNTGIFIGAISGILFIQTEKGPAAAGHMVCPAMLEIDLQNATQVGEGHCTITGDDGAKVFAEWSCQGVHLVGCDGEIKLTGGSGRMSGIAGGGALSVRTITQLAVVEAMSGDSMAERGRGILTLDNLVYTLPDQ